MTQEAFKAWWYNEGSQAPYTHHDCEEHTMRMCEIAWANGAYKEREALAQTQEPVCPDCKAKVLYECVACSSNNYPPQRTEQEPAGWEVGVVDGVVTRRLAPPQRTWVGLTDEDYFAVLEKLQNLYHRPPIAIFAKAIEAKLKEKNCG